jgi:hypothetical protein
MIDGLCVRRSVAGFKKTDTKSVASLVIKL